MADARPIAWRAGTNAPGTAQRRSERPCNIKHQQRNLKPVLRRPVENQTRTGHPQKTRLCSGRDRTCIAIDQHCRTQPIGLIQNLAGLCLNYETHRTIVSPRLRTIDGAAAAFAFAIRPLQNIISTVTRRHCSDKPDHQCGNVFLRPTESLAPDKNQSRDHFRHLWPAKRMGLRVSDSAGSRRVTSAYRCPFHDDAAARKASKSRCLNNQIPGLCWRMKSA